MLPFCIGISSHPVREDLDQPVAPEVSTPTDDQPPTEKNQEIHNPALCKLYNQQLVSVSYQLSTTFLLPTMVTITCTYVTGPARINHVCNYNGVFTVIKCYGKVHSYSATQRQCHTSV